MAMRNRYGYNCQKVNIGSLNQLVPLGYLDVVPGETIAGSVAVNFHSAPTKKEIITRVFADVFAYYMPYRLMWSGWPEFITGQDVVTEPPYVSDLFAGNFEQRFTVANAGGTLFTRNLAWHRRMFNLVGEKFFTAVDGSATVNLDLAGTRFAFMRPSTLETSPLFNIHATPVVAASLAVDDLRQAFATDAFEKMRRMYGDRYVDYLAAVGVKADFAMLEEPECIGQKHSDWKFRRVAASNNQTSPAQALGATAGYFASGVNVPIKRTFIPEHGLIGFYGVARADALYATTPVDPALSKRTREQYWSPEISGLRRARIDSQVFVDIAGVPLTQLWDFPQWQEYRMGLNEYGVAIPANNLSLTAATGGKAKNTEYYRSNLTPADFDANFDTTYLSGNHYQVTSQFRLVRNSPVKRVDIRQVVH